MVQPSPEVILSMHDLRQNNNAELQSTGVKGSERCH